MAENTKVAEVIVVGVGGVGGVKVTTGAVVSRNQVYVACVLTFPA